MMGTMTGVRKTRDQFIVRGPEREESPLRLQLSMRFKRLPKHPHQRRCFLNFPINSKSCL
jgi:hypothetical protein